MNLVERALYKWIILLLYYYYQTTITELDPEQTQYDLLVKLGYNHLTPAALIVPSRPITGFVKSYIPVYANGQYQFNMFPDTKTQVPTNRATKDELRERNISATLKAFH